MPFHSTFKVSDTYFREYNGDCPNFRDIKYYYQVIKRTAKTIVIKENKTGEEKRYKIRTSCPADDISYEYVMIAPHTRILSYNCNDVCELENYKPTIWII